MRQGLPACLLLSCLLAAAPAQADPPAVAHAISHTNAQARPHAAAHTEAVTVLSRLPHDPEAFTQGLLLHQGELFESTGLYGQSSLRRVDPATGRAQVRRSLPPKLFGEGLALCPEAGQSGAGPQRLIQLTWREGVILAYDPGSFQLVSRRKLRGQGWGLACSGTKLILSDGTDTLRFLDAHSLAETGRTLRVRDGGRPVERLNELEWVNGWLLANVWEEDRIAVIGPDDGTGTGQVALWLDLAPLRRELCDRAEAANGVAFDPAGDKGRGALYLTGKRWETIFVVALPELMLQPPPAAGP